jgi:hypothetical protein
MNAQVRRHTNAFVTPHTFFKRIGGCGSPFALDYGFWITVERYA